MTLMKIDLKNTFKGWLVWTILFAAIIFGFTAIYPEMITPEMKTSLDQMLGSFSPELLGIFNIQLTGPSSLVSPTGFFGYYFQYLFIAACIYGMLLGLNSLITEESEGTIEYLYAQPISRREIVGWKFLARLLLLTGFWLIAYGSSLASFALFKLQGDDLSAFIEEISKIFVAEYGVLVFFLCLGFFLSTILRSSKQTASVGLGCVFGLYLLGIVGELYDKLEWLAGLSPVRMALPVQLMDNGATSVLWVLLIGIICFFGTFYRYERKDLQV
ncbi:ABC transporter permease [Enterococcus casseliflavus]|nr:ABC transporter permease [Enterococcus casseliflavus]